MLETLGARRLLLIAALAVAVLVGGVAASNLASSTVYYLTPSEARARNVAVGQTVRLGGQVKAGSLECCFMYAGDGLRFVMTDGVSEVTVIGAGAVPGLLREGAGAVVEGTFMTDGLFHATQVIAKHDEVYTAPKAGATPAHRTGFP